MSNLKHMRDALILEIEQRVITLTHAQVGKGTFHLVSCDQVEVRSLRTGDVCDAVNHLLATVGTKERKVHVVLGDRRFVHTKIETPRLPSGELAAYVRREVLREAKLEGTTNLLLSCEVNGTIGRSKLQCGVVALPSEVWEPVRAGLVRVGVEVGSLSSVEDAATAICNQNQSRHLAILDLAGRGARFVQSDDGVVVRVRRFPLPSLDANIGSAEDQACAAPHLAVEIRRTLDHFKSAGLVSPEVLVLSHQVQNGNELLERVTGEVPLTEWFQLESNLCGKGLTPGLAALGTIRRLASGKVRDLRCGSGIDVPLSKSRGVATLMAGIATVILGTASAWVDHRVNNMSYEAHLMDEQAGILERSGAEDRAVRELETLGRKKLDRALRLRRPFSLAIAAICNATQESMALDELSIDDAGELVIEGTVRESSSLRALEIIGEFTSQLRALPYLKRPVESVDEGGIGEGVRFRVAAQWRLP